MYHLEVKAADFADLWLKEKDLPQLCNSEREREREERRRE